jgi:hypothetical protein
MTSAIDVVVTGRTYRTDVWFSAAGVSPLERRRDKIGRGANRKIFRFFADGVRRLRIEPDGRSEAKLAPDQWSNVQELFFPYGPTRADCAVLSDPNLLFVIAAAGAVTAEPLELCVFNKQAIYHVRLSAEPGETLEAENPHPGLPSRGRGGERRPLRILRDARRDRDRPGCRERAAVAGQRRNRLSQGRVSAQRGRLAHLERIWGPGKPASLAPAVKEN